MSLDSVVNVQITIQSSALTLPGFGVPLLAAIHSVFAERLRYYSDVAGMLTDGFTSSDRVVDMATVIFAQNPKPSRIAVGRRDTAVAMVQTISVTDATDGNYTVQIDGQNHTFAASGSTAILIAAGLITAINTHVATLGQTEVTAAPGVDTDELTITADTAGIPFATTLTSPVADGLNFFQNVSFAAAGADGAYAVTIGSVTHLVNATAQTATQIRDAMITQVNGGTSGVAASVGTIADTIDLERQASAFVVTAAGPSALPILGRTLSVGMAEDLAAITDFQADWYMLLVEDRDDANIRANADYIETVRKTYLAQSSDATIAATPFDSAVIQDIAASLKNLSYARTALCWATNDTNDIAAGWAGKQLPKVPASSTWKFKTIAGVVPDAVTTTQETNLDSKSANWYQEIAGRNIMREGTVAVGEFLDIIRGVDKLFQQIQANTFGLFVSVEKVDFTNGGLALLGAQTSAALRASTTDGLIASSRPNAVTLVEETPAFTVTVPNIADISAADRAKRLVPATNPITFEGTLAGAVHELNVRGTLSA